MVHAVPNDLGLERIVERLTRQARRSDQQRAAEEKVEARASLEQEVRTALIESCERALGRASATWQEDRAEIANVGCEVDHEPILDPEGRRAAALTYRAGKKVLLARSDSELVCVSSRL